MIALGLLLFMVWGVNPATMTFENPWATLFSVVMIVVGVVMFRRGLKIEQSKNSKDEKK